MCETNKLNYEFRYCSNKDFDYLKSNQKCYRTRICYIGNSFYRLYLLKNNNCFYIEPYYCKEYQWYKLPLSKVLTEMDLCLEFDTEDEFKDIMSEVFKLQFPQAQSSFFNMLPDKDLIINIIEENNDLRTLYANGFYFKKETRVNIPDCNGYIILDVVGGELRVPFKNTIKGDFLIPSRCKFISENSVKYIFFKIFDEIEEFIRNIFNRVSWMQFRSFVNKYIK